MLLGTLVTSLGSVASGALAQPAPAPASAKTSAEASAEASARLDPASTPLDLPSLDALDVLLQATARVAPAQAAPEELRLSLHGELELRYHANRDLRLEAPLSHPELDKLGQEQLLYGWLRLRPALRFGTDVELAGQVDIARGLIVGDTTEWVGAAREPLDAPLWEATAAGAKLRTLWLQVQTPIGQLRLGQQASHWGMGLLENDGDHATLFGDPSGGTLCERLDLVAQPLGITGPLEIGASGGLVFEDRWAQLLHGERALQLLGTAQWRSQSFELGVHGGYRYQERDHALLGGQSSLREWLEVGQLSVAGRFVAPVPSAPAVLFGQAEGVLVAGSTNMTRTAEQARSGDSETITSFGGALVLGVAVQAQDLAQPAPADEGKPQDRSAQRIDPQRWGELVLSVELGYASGDAQPADGTSRRFVFDPNHHVGLVLFEHVLGWKTARAANIAQDPSIVGRGAPGLELWPSGGGVAGASYLYPTLLVRPVSWLDLKAGVLVAQASADVVDPARYWLRGEVASYDGGNARRHDLGLELDLGVDTRLKPSDAVGIELGAEGGLLLAGHAFDDEAGEPLGAQYLLTIKAGLEF